jgi:hypothetical protein
MSDYEAPLWEQMKSCMRMLDTALLECKDRGSRMVACKARYYSVKSQHAFQMREKGFPVTFIQDVIKGVPEVNEAMSEYNAAEVEYENAREARNVVKKKLDTLREQYAREWSQAKED